MPDTPQAKTSLHVLRAAYDKLNIDVEGRILPAMRCLMESEAGHTDGEVHRSPEIEETLPNLIRVPVAVNILDIQIYARPPGFEVQGWKDLRSKTLGIRIGMLSIENSTADFPNLIRKPDNATLFELLQQARVDAVVTLGIRNGCPSHLIQTGQILALEPPLERIMVYHYLHTKHAGILPQLIDVLREMQGNGELQRLREEARMNMVCDEPKKALARGH
ncbi:MAG: hypothetical protein V3573_13560 [Desulfovibrionaceae bacterium]